MTTAKEHSSSKRAKRADQEFLAPALEILETPPSPVQTAILTLICSFAVTALIWAYVGRVDIVAVSQGKFQPTGKVKVIQPVVTGKVVRLPPANGTYVKAGDILLELDPTQALSEEKGLRDKLNSTEAEATRRVAAIAAARQGLISSEVKIAWAPTIPADIRLREEQILLVSLDELESTLSALRAQRSQKEAEQQQKTAEIEAQQSLIDTLRQRVDMRNTLVSRTAGTISSVIDATELMKTRETDLVTLVGEMRVASAGATVFSAEIDKTLRAFVSDQAQKLGQCQREAEELRNLLAKAESQRRQLTIESPVEGILQASVVFTLGQVVTTGQDLARVVPLDSELEIEVYVLNRDIGFIQPGQSAVVKVESFPFTRYGSLEATVKKIATDSLPQQDAQLIEGNPNATSSRDRSFSGTERIQNLVFPVTLRPEKDVIDADGVVVALTPGMAVTVEIKTGSRRILEYLFSPLVEVASRAFRER
jgi:hemolysin D|nr:HlyD family type I secretion periplasmic adaptor subunit [Neorhizobium tomejilense]